MALSLPTVNTAADTFQNWVDKTNTIFAALANNVITANSQANGALTSGNGFVNGYFGATVLSANSIKGGANLQSSANLNLTTNLVITGTHLYVGANALINATAHFIGNSTSNAYLTQTLFSMGNSTVNATVNSTAFKIFSGNSVYGDRSITFGNNTVNAVVNTTGIYINNSQLPFANNKTQVAVDGVDIGSATKLNFSGAGAANVSATVHSAGSQINVIVNATVSLSGGAGGSNTHIIYNDSGSLGGTAAFTFDESSNTVSISNTLAVGANVTLTTVHAKFGNSTVNSTMNSVTHSVGNSVVNTSGLYLGSNVVVTYALGSFGNSTVNSVINSTSVSTANVIYTTSIVGGNVTFTTTGYSLGNSTVNATGNSISYIMGSHTKNTSTYTIGANVSVNTSVLLVGNSTQSFTTNSVSLQVANSTTAAIVNSFGLSVGSNVTVSFANLVIGTSHVNSSAVSTALLTGATIANTSQYWANTASKVMTTDVLNLSGAYRALTDAASISWDMANGINFEVTLGGNRTLANPTNPVIGRSGVLKVVEDATGGRTLSYGSNYYFDSNTAPAITTTANKENYLFYHVVTSTKILITLAAKGV